MGKFFFTKKGGILSPSTCDLNEINDYPVLVMWICFYNHGKVDYPSCFGLPFDRSKFLCFSPLLKPKF